MLGSDKIWCLMDNHIYSKSFGNGDYGMSPELNMFSIPIETALTQGVFWENMGQTKRTNADGAVSREYESTTGFRGAQRYNLARGKLYNRGDCIAFFGGIFDNQFTPDEGLRGTIWFRFGGWETKPFNTRLVKEFSSGTQDGIFDVRLRPTLSYQDKGRFFNLLEWHSFLGAPAGTLYAPRYPQFEETRSGATRNWDQNRTRITQYSKNDYLFYKFEDPTVIDYEDPSFGSSNPPPFNNTPRFNMAFGINQFVSAYKWNGEDKKLGTASGSCVYWTGSILSGGESDFSFSGRSNAPRGMGVRIETYVKSGVGKANVDQQVCLNISISDTDAQIYDMNGLQELAVMSLASTSGEFRLSLRPRENTNGTLWDRQGFMVDVVLAFRAEGSAEWQYTSILRPSTNPVTITYKQEIRFGVFPVSTDSQKVQASFTSFGVHTYSDLGVFDNRIGSSKIPRCIRGRTTSSSEIYTDEGVALVWGGAGGAEADMYSFETEYTNAFLNCVKYDSPRIRWSSGTAMNTNNGTLITSGGDGLDGFYHNAVSVFGTNAKNILLRYGSSLSASLTISMLRATGRIEESKDDAIRINWDDTVPTGSLFSSTAENRKFFAHFSNVQNPDVVEGTSYLVSRHIKDRNGYQWLQCAGVTLSFDDSSLVGTTVEIYADRGWAVMPSSIDEKIRVVLQGSNWNAWELSNSKQELYLGTIIVGTTLSLEPVEMNWSYSDEETSNVSVNKTRSGLQWGYREGPSQRKISGSFQGDTSHQVRRYLRDTLRSVTNFNEYGLVFVYYDVDPTTDTLSDDYFILARNDDNLKMENIGWYYDENDENWRPVGNITLSLTEIV